jgi:hypothetical protein
VHPDLPVAVADVVGEPQDAEQVDVALDGRGDPPQRDPPGGGDVRQARGEARGDGVQQELNRGRPWFDPTNTAGWSASYANGSVRDVSSCPAP